MSWGERSCKWYYDAKHKCEPTLSTCNVDCLSYVPLPGVVPDSVRKNLAHPDPLEFVAAFHNFHHGTCDSCGATTGVTRENLRGYEYLCGDCMAGIFEGRKRPCAKS